MKVKIENILLTGIILQIISTQGILTFNIFKILGEWELKSIIHPIGVSLVLVYFVFKMIKEAKATTVEFFMFGYLSVCFVLLLFNSASFTAVFFGFREVILLPLLVYIYSQVNISEKLWGLILKSLYFLILANLFFIALTYYLGPLEYMNLLTGRYFWGHDPLYKFKISNFYSFWRSPGLVGSGGSMGYFALISYILLDGHVRYKTKKYLGLLLVCLCFIRSVYLALFIYIVFSFFVKKKNLKRFQIFIKFSIPLFVLLSVFLNKKNILSLESVFMRKDNWFNNINFDYNVLFGGSIGKLGAAVRGQGFIATIDSYWVYMFLSTGLIGVVLVVLFFYEKSLGSNKLKTACIALLLAGFFVSFNQSISFLVLFPLLFLKRNEI